MKLVKYIFLFAVWAQATVACAQNATLLDSLSWARDLFLQEKVEDAKKVLADIEESCNQSTFGVQIVFNYIKGATYYTLEMPDEAIPCFIKAVVLIEEHCDTIKQDFYECLYGLGDSYLALGDTINAEKSFRHAFVHSLSSPAEVIRNCGVLGDIVHSLGDIYNAKGDSILARDIYDYAVRIHLTTVGPTGVECLSPDVLNGYVETQNAEGLKFLRAKQYTAAIKRFTDLIRLCNDNQNEYWQGYLFHNLGRTWMLLGDYEKALQCLERAEAVQIKVSGSTMDRTITYINECKKMR